MENRFPTGGPGREFVSNLFRYPCAQALESTMIGLPQMGETIQARMRLPCAPKCAIAEIRFRSEVEHNASQCSQPLIFLRNGDFSCSYGPILTSANVRINYMFLVRCLGSESRQPPYCVSTMDVYKSGVAHPLVAIPLFISRPKFQTLNSAKMK